MTGVQRYTSSILGLLDDEILKISPRKRLGQVSGHLWEQLFLPNILKGGALWSPANTGPLSYPNQVVTIHDVSVLDHPEWFNKKFSTWYNYLMPKLINNVRVVITDSEFSKERILSHVDVSPEKIIVTPLGVDLRFRENKFRFTREEFNVIIGVDRDYVLCVGSVEPRKNLVNLVKAWDKVPAHIRRDYVLLIVGGSGNVFSEIQFDVLPDDVKFIGRVEDEILPELYKYAALFLYPSLYEGFGLPVLEAMASGTPVLTSNSSSLPEVVGQAALQVDPANVESIANGICDFLSSDNLRILYSNLGRERSMLFGWERTAVMTAEILSSTFDS